MSPNTDLSFENMTARYGEITAYSYLEQIERASGIAPQSMVGIAPELRLMRAIVTQDSAYRHFDLAA